MDTSQVHLLFLILHLFGVAIGAGGAFISDSNFFASLSDNKVSRDEFKILKNSSKMVWIGLLLLVISGVGFFALNPEGLSQSSKFLTKMTIVLVIILNGIIFHIIHMPFIKKHLGEILATEKHRNRMSEIPLLIISGVISMVSWSLAIILGALSKIPISYMSAISLYIILISISIFSSFILFKKYLTKENNKKIIKISGIMGLVGIVLFILSIFTVGFLTTNSLQTVPKDSYSRDDVALHNNPEDCWVIVDDLVFNVTDAAKLHPAMFHCGEDASVNYHKNHGKGIREKMMVFKIGTLNDLKGISNIDSNFNKKTQLTPYEELYVKAGSWNNHELIVVVEKDAEKLLFIDGSNHKPVGRIHDIGFQPHTSVFSSDAKFMYIISRDGWLTKIDLDTLISVKSVSVGINSRGTALTDDGKYIAIGNYEPGNVVILDANTMEILKEIPLIGKKDGEEIESRAGVLVENGSKIIVALKDLTSVWIIDTAKKDFPVTNKFNDIGKNIPALHDGYLTPEGKHFIVSSQGSKTVWVLDLETMKPIAEVETGDTPHTGPGATWGNITYVPALGEGLITGIDMTTWKAVAKIKTAGPGLFIRSYPKDPLYPYIWADTAFGEFHDEIYVIDARINKIIKTIRPVPGKSSWHPEFTYDGKFVYVVSQGANEVEVYNAHTFELVKRIESNTPSAVSNVGLRIEEPGL